MVATENPRPRKRAFGPFVSAVDVGLRAGATQKQLTLALFCDDQSKITEVLFGLVKIWTFEMNKK
jgi:hypothetical protein